MLNLIPLRRHERYCWISPKNFHIYVISSLKLCGDFRYCDFIYFNEGVEIHKYSVPLSQISILHYDYDDFI